MPRAYNHYSVFISSPSDVNIERGMCERTVERVSTSVADLLRLTLVPNAWERHPPETPQVGRISIQDGINDRVKASDVFVLILGSRYGTIEPNHTKSNTEREVEAILEKKSLDPRVTILCYLKHLPDNPDAGPQEMANRAFRERLQHFGVMWKQYSDHSEFEKEIIHDFYKLAIRLRTSTFKIECLAKFWLPSAEASEHDRPVASEIAIIYRPVLRQFEDQSHDKEFWHKRLMPNVIFEDAKAIQKIQKMARLLGIQSKVFMIYDVPPEVRLMNRIWVCSPRMERAQEAARIREACFKFERRTQGVTLHWKRGNEVLKIRSPLSAYLLQQRKPEEMEGEWSHSLGNIVARDFAVIARLPANSMDFALENQTYDYFIAGIRGLGTWGATWFIDRKSRQLRDAPSAGRHEMLIEVRYRSGSIEDVVDVSEYPASYFADQCSPRTVLRNIKSAQ